MHDWSRTSVAVKVKDTRPALREALGAFATAHALALDELDAVETRSVRPPGWLERWRGTDTTSWSAVTLAPGLVVWATQPERSDRAQVLAARLADVTIERGVGGRLAALVRDPGAVSGLSLSGVFVGREATAMAFLGLGPEQAGPFERRLREAARDAGNPLHGLG